MRVWLIMRYAHLCTGYAGYAEHTPMLARLRTTLKTWLIPLTSALPSPY